MYLLKDLLEDTEHLPKDTPIFIGYKDEYFPLCGFILGPSFLGSQEIEAVQIPEDSSTVFLYEPGHDVPEQRVWPVNLIALSTSTVMTVEELQRGYLDRAVVLQGSAITFFGEVEEISKESVKEIKLEFCQPKMSFVEKKTGFIALTFNL